MTIDNDNLESRHVVQVNFPIPKTFACAEFDFIDCLGCQVNDIHVTPRDSPLGSNIVFQFAELIKHNGFDDEMPQSLALKSVQDIVPVLVSYFHTNPPEAFSLQSNCENAKGVGGKNQ
jgi:hypothetical protein